MKKGISLIVLIITIIVVVILAGTVILNLNNTNIIKNAEQAVTKNDEVAAKVEWDLFLAKEYLDYKGDRDTSLYSMYEGELLYNEGPTGFAIDDIFTNKDGIAGIVEGKVIFGDELPIPTYDILLQKLNNVGATSAEYCHSVIEVEDGYVACGYSLSGDFSNILDKDGNNAGGSVSAGSFDFVVMKFDNDLGLVKINNFGGNSGDLFYSIIEVSDGYIAVGKSQSDLSGLLAVDGTNAGGSSNSLHGPSRYVIAKLDRNLELVKINNFDSSYNNFHSVIEIDGGYVACGDANFNNPKSLFSVIKFNDNLEVVTTKEFGGSDYDTLRSIIKVEDGYVAIGYSKSSLISFTGGSTANGDYDFVIMKLDNNLELVKINNFGGGEHDMFQSVIKVEDGYIAAGYSENSLNGILNKNGENAGGSINQGSYDAVIVKFDDDLDLLKINNFGGVGSDTLNSIIKQGDDYIVAGYSESDLNGILNKNGENAGGSINQGGYDSVIAKLDNNLDLVKINNFGGTDIDHITSLVKGYKGYVIAGYSKSDLSTLLAANGSNAGGTVSAGNYDFVIMKLGD